MGTGAVSRYNLSRSQKFVMVQYFDCVQRCVSGYNNHYEFVLGAGAKAKTVTSNLPLLSVLGLGIFLVIIMSPLVKVGNYLFMIWTSTLRLMPLELSSVEFIKGCLLPNPVYSSLDGCMPLFTNQLYTDFALLIDKSRL